LECYKLESHEFLLKFRAKRGNLIALRMFDQEIFEIIGFPHCVRDFRKKLNAS
jgi:hypothetical protein